MAKSVITAPGGGSMAKKYQPLLICGSKPAFSRKLAAKGVSEAENKAKAAGSAIVATAAKAAPASGGVAAQQPVAIGGGMT